MGNYGRLPKCLLGLALVALLFGTAWGQTAGTDHKTALAGNDPSRVNIHALRPSIVKAYGNLPLSFEKNEGQTDPRVKFLAHGQGYGLFLAPTQAVLALQGPPCKHTGAFHPISLSRHRHAVPCSARGTDVRLQLIGANPNPQVTGLDLLPGKSNYLIGNNPNQWHTNVPNYGKVKYESVYPGIDLVYYGNQHQLEFDVVVAPGADPHLLRFKVSGAKKLTLNSAGDLVLHARGGDVSLRRPVVYQSLAGAKREVEGHYILKGREVAFEVGTYDHTQPLVVDPTLVYATYLGGLYDDAVNAIAVDSGGNLYVTGQTGSSNFPTVGGLQAGNPLPGCSSQPNVCEEAFVSKINAAGTALVYSTYIDGCTTVQNTPDCDFSSGNAIAVDASGNVYIGGSGDSVPEVPANNPISACRFGLQPLADDGTAWVAKLNPAGTALMYSVCIAPPSGSPNAEGGVVKGIAVDSSGDAYITGISQQASFPTTPGVFEPTWTESSILSEEAFVAELNSAGTALLYSTYLGGANLSSGSGIAIDSSGNAYVIGTTVASGSTGFPLVNPGQTCNASGYDDFVAKLTAGGTALSYSTCLGIVSASGAGSIAVDSSGAAYVVGDVVAKLSPAGSFVYMLGSDTLYPQSLWLPVCAGGGIALDSAGDVYSSSTWDPSIALLQVNPIQQAQPTSGAWFCASEINATGTALLFQSLIDGGSGSGETQVTSTALDGTGNLYVAGDTGSTDFQTLNPLQSANAGSYDVALMKVAMGTGAVPVASLSTGALSFGSVVVGTTSSPTSFTVTDTGTVDLTFTYTPPGIAFFAEPVIIHGTNAADFEVSADSCSGQTLAPKTTCSISIRFKPSVASAESATLYLLDNAAPSPQTISLTGTGISSGPTASLSPASITFPSQTVGTTSAGQDITLTNTGNVSLSITGIAITGADPGDFSETNNCGSSVAAGASCNISVTFKPTVAGTLTASVSVTDNASGSPQTVSLVGTATSGTGGGSGNPVPFINQPLVPDTALPGASGFTLTVTGAGFGSGAKVEWNGTALATTVVSSKKLTAAVPAANVATAGTAAITVVNGVPGVSSNVVFFPVATAIVSPTFANATGSPVAVGNTPNPVAVGDFNGDGIMDLVTVNGGATSNSATDNVTILLGNGDGTFKQAPGSPVAVGASPTGVAVGDFNGDGKLDLAVVNSADGTVTILLGNGDGTFTQASSSPVTVGPRGGATSIAVGDFNGDGKLDLAIGEPGAPGTGSVAILLGNGDGTFVASAPFTLGVGPGKLVVGDFNGDGKLDLAIADEDASEPNNTVSIYLGNGDGTFTQASGSPIALGVRAADITSADFNHDGNLDLAIAGLGSTGNVNSVSVLLGKGDGTFTQATGSPFAAGPYGSDALSVGDFNGDGNLDVAVSNSDITTGQGAVTILLGDGTGSFKAAPTPPATGSYPYSVTVGDFNGDGRLDLAVANAGDNTVSVLLQQVQGPAVKLSPANLTFASQTVGTSSAAQSIMLTNSGNAALSISGISITGTNAADYTQTNTCGTSVAANGTCTISVTFTPTATGTRTASVSITDNASGSPQTVSLTGTGTEAVVSLAPSSGLTFPSQTVGTTSAGQDITLTNAGNVSLSITGIAITGADSGDFSETNNCGSSVSAGASCNISVTFKPTVAGTLTASVSVTDNASGSPQTVPLTGTGVAATAPAVTLSPTSLTFPSQGIGSTSTAQTITLTNSGSAALNISGITIAGADSGDFSQTNTCASSVAAGANCTISVSFTPTAVGTRTASVSISDNASGSPQTVALSGTATASAADFSISASPTALTIAAGSSGKSTLTVTPSNGFNQAVTFDCSGLPAEIGCIFSPASVTPNGAAVTTTLTVTAGSNISSLNRSAATPSSPGNMKLAIAGGLVFLFSLGGLRRRALGWLTPLLCICLLGICTACGSSGGQTTNVQKGNYTVVVSGISGSGAAGITHTTTITVTVQ